MRGGINRGLAWGPGGGGGQPGYCAQCWALCVEMGKGEQRTSGSRIPWGSLSLLRRSHVCPNSKEITPFLSRGGPLSLWPRPSLTKLFHMGPKCAFCLNFPICSGKKKAPAPPWPRSLSVAVSLGQNYSTFSVCQGHDHSFNSHNRVTASVVQSDPFYRRGDRLGEFK